MHPLLQFLPWQERRKRYPFRRRHILDQPSFQGNRVLPFSLPVRKEISVHCLFRSRRAKVQFVQNPVSYTHLDVYKRQVLYLWQNFCKIVTMKKFFSVLTFLLFAFAFPQKFDNIQSGETLNYRIHYGILNAGTATLTTVSYTHLDVYKRQGFGAAASPPLQIPLSKNDNIVISNEVRNLIHERTFVPSSFHLPTCSF